MYLTYSQNAILLSEREWLLEEKRLKEQNEFFVKTFIHDVRKPFTLVKMFIQMFNKNILEKTEIDEYSKEIDNAIKTVEAMIEDVIDSSREVKLITEPSSLITIFEYSIKQLMQSYKDVDIQFQYNYTHKHKPLLDNQKIIRVINNIIANGIEAITIIGKQNNGVISISSKQVVIENKQMIEIVISNNGPCIDNNDIPKLFTKSFTKGKKAGTGLGLASVKRIIDLHDGNITVKNKCNNLNNQAEQGVDFIIHLPASSEVEYY